MNIASSGSGSGSVCDLAGGCAGWMGGDTGSLVLSIVVTLILVGALFYYVKQRVEILETSQKEQIHIMQSFIASIGDQFHRMNVYIQHKLGSTTEVTTNEDSKQQQQQQQQQHTRMGSSRIDISDHDDDQDDTKVIHLRSESESESDSDSGSDSDSDSSSDGGESNDSKSSNTTRESWLGSKQYKQIKIHDMDTDSAAVDNDEIHDDGIKVVEIDPQFIHCARSQAGSGSESDSGSDSDSDSDSQSDSGSQNETNNMVQDIHVIKVDSGSSLEISEKGAGSGSEKEKEKEKEKGAQKKTLVLDLEKEEVSAPSAGAQYSSLSIKQLRQLVKKKSILLDGENEISKMKREQLIELLLSSNQQ